MKRIVCVIALWSVALLVAPAAIASPTAGGGWSWVLPEPQGSPLTRIDFVSPIEGWTLGDYRTLLHTIDGGTTWTPQLLPGDAQALDFVDAQNGWAVGRAPTLTTEEGSRTAVYRTQDGGSTWDRRLLPDSSFFPEVSFADPLHGFIASGEGTVWRTVDGGATWSAVALPGLGQVWLRHVAMVDDLRVWVAGERYTGVDMMPLVLASGDGGATWVEQPVSGVGAVGGLAMTASGAGWCLADQAVLRTTDGGDTWAPATPPVGDARWETVTTSSDGLRVWVSGARQVDPWDALSYRSLDGGTTWEEMSALEERTVMMLQAVDDDTVVALGASNVLLQSDSAGQSWAVISPGVTLPDMRGISFTSASEGWAVGGYPPNGGMVHTTDGGLTWTAQTLPGTWDEYSWFGPTDVVFVDALHGWTVGTGDDDAAIAVTTDGGATWAQQYFPAPATDPYVDLAAVDFTDATHGWAVGSDDTVIRTVDGGATWSIRRGAAYTYAADWTDVDAVGAARCWAVGSYGPGGIIARTTDGGAHWTDVKPKAARHKVLTGVCFTSSLNGWAVGTNGLILHTVDGGKSWKSVSPGPLATDFTDVDFSDAKHGWITADYESWVWRTTDGGVTWRMQDTWGPGFSEVDAVGSSTIYLAGHGGISKTTRAGVSPLDASSPVTTITKPGGTWHNHRVKLTFAVSERGSGLLYTYCRLGRFGTFWALDSLTIVPTDDGSWDGLLAVSAASTDVAGGGGKATGTVQVGLDTSLPTTYALKNVTVRPGSLVALPYKVGDWKPGCGRAKVTLKIFNAKGKTLRSVSWGTRRTNVKLSGNWRCDLRAGTYGWFVVARDIAGNPTYKAYYSLLKVGSSAGSAAKAAGRERLKLAAPELTAAGAPLTPWQGLEEPNARHVGR